HDLALPLQEEVVRRATGHFGATNRDTLAAIGNLGETYLRSGQLDKAVRLLEEALKLADAASDRSGDIPLSLRNNLAICYARQGRETNPIELLQRLLKEQQSPLPTNHPSILTTMANLASLHKEIGDLDNARRQYEQALSLCGTNGTDSRNLTITRGLASV